MPSFDGEQVGETGAVHHSSQEGTIMKRIIAIAAAAGALSVVGGGVAQAGTDNPTACFGQDRSGAVHTFGGEAWGDLASNRAGTNSTHNADWKAGSNCGSLSGN